MLTSLKVSSLSKGDDRRLRRLQQMRLSKQFPGVLAELEHLTFEGASELLGLLRSYSDEGAELSNDARCGLHLVSDYHFALRVVLGREDRFLRRLPDRLVTRREGREPPVGLVVGFEKSMGWEANLRYGNSISGGFVGPSGLMHPMKRYGWK